MKYNIQFAKYVIRFAAPLLGLTFMYGILGSPAGMNMTITARWISGALAVTIAVAFLYLRFASISNPLADRNENEVQRAIDEENRGRLITVGGKKRWRQATPLRAFIMPMAAFLLIFDICLLTAWLVGFLWLRDNTLHPGAIQAVVVIWVLFMIVTVYERKTRPEDNDPQE